MHITTISSLVSPDEKTTTVDVNYNYAVFQ